MPRIARGQVAGYAYHIINRGNGRTQVFHKPQDYAVFLELLALAKARHGVKVFGFCLMPNHFHFVLESSTNVALSRFMQWLLTSHVRRYHHHYHSSGHVWQGRFKSFPIQRDEHLLVVLRYVVQNPVRAGLVKSPGEWAWSSIQRKDLTDPCPAYGEADWGKVVEDLLPLENLKVLRDCVNRQQPFGSTWWQLDIAKRLGLEATLRPRGRPRIEAKSRVKDWRCGPQAWPIR